ncbi:protein O-linked-mannose beta-1,2-N-acetylglucosaminyltransferase 1-like [Gigantopelta aegis]|uniref:protein O-linked-mannose beta-1,2-N-acetylglucosaminyltransferase 1-like n=1 Tax=Gigantopelta aegis TaxID=1735272 RepID=UPI001B88B232|nr:protein O-linked-mannose beta-1,2-N-acetylglucosaminyltransferase 1-like [Gigantopelta aegis]XP_041349880.1 protein O-linked-mannose beta-1,2-N-acetylglucosaminyltransferase 1-like [Gigantopelta aegis]
MAHRSGRSGPKIIRSARRFINRKFGSVKQFLAIVFCVCVIIYCIHLILSESNRQIWDVRGDLNLSDSRCGVKCEPNQVAFYIRTGEGNKLGPTICLEGEVLISPELKNYGRGLNIVSVNDKTLEVTNIKTFDTYLEDTGLIRFLKKTVPQDHIVLIASFDESSGNLKEDGKQWLKLYGSGLADNVQFRDGLLMIGQKGLHEGNAVEFLSKRENGQDFANVVEKAGCFSVPMGSKRSLQVMLPKIIRGSNLMMGQVVPNCGVQESCGPRMFPVSVFTGHGNEKQPEICVSGKIVMSETVNDAGRGFNVVVVDHKTGRATMLTRVDTYTYDSTDLEIFLESLADGNIVIAVVADDGAKKLSYMAQELLNKLGSGLIQNLRFRDVWYFVGQKGIQGFTKMEMISYAGFEGEWPKALKAAFCVPTKIIGQAIVPDPDVIRNDARRNFCKKYDGYFEYCDPSHVDEFPKTVRVIDQAFSEHPIFSVPIVVVPGLNHNALVRSLETTLMQPGIQPNLVCVLWDEKFPEHGELAFLYGFSNFSLPSSTKYSEQMVKALRKIEDLHPDSEYVIVLEEELLLAPDFLHFMAQFLDVLNSDSSLLGVSAWNYNSYEVLAGNRHAVYRVEEFPGLGFLLSLKYLKSVLASSLDKCCNTRSWHGWDLGDQMKAEILIPDISRVFRQRYQGTDGDEDLIQQLFHKPRATNLEPSVKLEGLNNLTAELYEEYLNLALANSVSFPTSDLRQCLQYNKAFKPELPNESRHVFVVYYEQENPEDYELLRKLCHCFGLFSVKNHKPKNLHNGLLRFFYHGLNVFLVGSATEYYQHKPSLVTGLKKNLISPI